MATKKTAGSRPAKKEVSKAAKSSGTSPARATQKTVPAPKAAGKARTMKPAAKKTTQKKPLAKGNSFSCSVCGLTVIVDEVCGCATIHPLICCEKEMRRKR